MEHGGTRVDLIVVGDDHAALTSRDDLAGLKAEGTHIANATQCPAAKGTTIGLRRVLQHQQTVFLGNLHDRGHVGGNSPHVHRHDDLGVRGDVGPHRIRVQRQRVVDLGDDGHGSDGQNGRYGRDPTERRNDHLISRANCKPLKCAEQSCRARSDSERMLGAVGLSHLEFQPPSR